MTASLIAIYKTPDDKQAFDEHYFNTHSPLAAKMPGLKDLKITRLVGSPMGNKDLYLMCEMTFDSLDAVKAALSSPEGAAAGKDLMGFAGTLVQLYFAEPASAPVAVS